jgi:serine/threonine protein kinase
MGTVYLAHDTELDRRVALKVPHAGAGSARLAEQFQREARAAAALNHPNVCPVHDVGQVDGVPYLTMAYVEGEPLSALVRSGGPVPPARAGALVAAVARALGHAHEHGVVHRDLKPSNILMDRAGRPVVTDFGLARRVNVDSTTANGMLAGSPVYMAPEQIAPGGEPVGPGCDVYALGVVLYELLTGRPPFDGTLNEVLARALHDAPVPPSRHRPGLDPRLDAICLKALAKKPSARFRSMAAFAAVLESRGTVRALPKRRAVVLTAVAVVLIVATGVAVKSIWFAGKKPDAPAPGGGSQPAPAVAPPAADVGQLLRDLESKDPDERLNAAVALKDYRSPEVVRALAKAMNNPQEQHASIRRETAESLRHIGDPSAVPALAMRVADERWFDRIKNTFAKHRNPDKEWVSDPFEGGKESALNALRAVGTKDDVKKALEKAMKSSNPNVRGWAAERYDALVKP